MLAHERLKLLAGRYASDVVEEATKELGRMAIDAGWAMRPGTPAFDEWIDAVRRDQSMAGDLRGAMMTLRSRVVDAGLAERLDALDGRIAAGVTADGVLSAAVFAYPDDSYLVLFDHALMLCMWFAAQLAAVSASDSGGGIAPEDACAAIQLALARPAVAARAGPLPPLLLSEAEMALASELTAEIDRFLFAHEMAHVLLGHFAEGRQALGALVGPSTTADGAIDREHAADLLALTLLLDDIDQGTTGTEQLPMRLAAVRLALVLIDRYERTCFVLQPVSHPPAAARFALLTDRALTPWFGEQLPALLAPLTSFIRAIAAPPGEDLTFAAGRVDRGLDGRLDRALWDAKHWAQVAQLAGFVVPRLETARRDLRHAFPATADGERDLAALIAELVADPATQQLVARAAGGEPLTRLGLVEHAGELLAARGRTELAVWAIAGLMASVIHDLAEPLIEAAGPSGTAENR